MGCAEVKNPTPSQHIMQDAFPMLTFETDGAIKLAFWDVDTGYSDDEDLLKLRQEFERIVNRDMNWTKIEAGDILIINNEVAVHARKSFRATFDENDRHIMRTLCVNVRSCGSNFNEAKWMVDFPTCTQKQCICLNANSPNHAKLMNLITINKNYKYCCTLVVTRCYLNWVVY